MDEILDKLGPWHYPILVLNAFGALSYLWSVMAMQFMAPKDLDYWCARPNDSISLEHWREINDGVDLHCYTKDFNSSSTGVVVTSKPCDAWEFDHSIHTRTLTEEWQAVCGREQLISYSQSMLMAGQLGNLLILQLADWYGRRTTILLSYLLCSLTGFSVVATSAFWSFSLARMASFAVTISVDTFVYESVGARQRAMMAMLNQVPWLTGLMTFPLVTYFVRDWRWIQTIITMPAVFFFGWTLFLDESPKWLVSSGHFDEAKRILDKVVRRHKLQNVSVESVIEKARTAIETERKAQGRASLVDLFNRLFIIKTTIICTLNNMTMALLYFYLLYFTVDLGSNPYLNLIFTALTEAPVCLFGYVVLQYVRRKPVYNIAYPLIIISLVALFFFQNGSATVQMVLSAIAKLCGLITWHVLCAHTNEVYPTPVRAISSGFMMVGAQIGAVAAPLLHPLNGTSSAWVPIAVIVCMCVVAWTAAYFLPETFGRSLPDTFSEAKIVVRSANTKMKEDLESKLQITVTKSIVKSESRSSSQNSKL